MGSFFIKDLIFFGGSLVIPITTRSSANFFLNSFSSGIDSLQGGHQVAQKSIKTTLPLVSGALPFTHFSTCNGGASLPRKSLSAKTCFLIASGYSSAAVACAPRRAAIVVDKMRKRFNLFVSL